MKIPELKWDQDRGAWYLEEEEAIEFLVELLGRIGKETFGEGREVFNAFNLVRQNFLTITEEPGKIFGQPYLLIKRLGSNYLYSIRRIEYQVVSRVLEKLRIREASDDYLENL